MKIIIVMSFFISLTINSLQKDEIIIAGKAVQGVRIPIEQMPLICDESDHVLCGSLLFSGLALTGTTIYGIFTHPFPFNDHDCGGKYRQLLFNQSNETGVPCNLEKTSWYNCIESLVKKYCDADRSEYNQELPDKKIAAWSPLMVVTAATVGFQAGWLLGKWIARTLNKKPPFSARASTAIEMEQV